MTAGEQHNVHPIGGSMPGKGAGEQMGIKKSRWGKDLLGAGLRFLFGEPVAARQRVASPPQPRQEVSVLPCQGMPAYPDHDDDEIDLLRLWQVIWRARNFIVLFTLTCTLIAVLITLFVLPVTYKSEAVLVPTDSQSGGLGGLASLAGSLPIPINLPGGGKSDLILTFLQSRNLQQRLIEKYNLLPRWYDNIWDAKQSRWLVSEEKRNALLVRILQERGLKTAYTVSQDKKTNLLTLAWVDEDPVFAAEMLKRVTAELSYYLNNEYESDAMRERQFVEKQLAQSTSDLERWERKIPTAEVTLAEIQRERLAAQTVYTELRKQLELAKISEAKELVRFKVLDPPFVPEKKFKPKRSLICALTLMASGMLSIFFVLGYHAVLSRKEE